MSTTAVALAVALLVVVASLFNGFINNVENTGRQVFGDIYLNPWISIPQYQLLIDKLDDIECVDSAAMTVKTYGLLRLDTGNVKPAQVIGIDPEQYSRVTQLQDYLLIHKDSSSLPNFSDNAQDNQGFVAVGVLASADEQTDQYDFESIKKQWLGKELILTTGIVTSRQNQDNQSITKIKQKHYIFKISDFVFTGLHPLDTSTVFLPIDSVRGLAGSNAEDFGTFTEAILIKLHDNTDPQKAIPLIKQTWQNFASEQNLPSQYISNPQIVTSSQLQKSYILELQKQMDLLMIIFGIVCSAAVMLIFCILYMIVMNKQKDIAVIKSFGAGKTTICTIFLGFGGCIGLAGSLVGIAIGWFIIRNINFLEQIVRVLFGIKLWKSSVYMFTKIPNSLDITAAGWILLSAVIAAVFGALVPAIVAARTNPVKILRYE